MVEAPARLTDLGCPVCGGSEGIVLLRRGAVPVHQNLLEPTAAAATACARGDVELVQCVACGFVFNRVFDQTRLRYGPGYLTAQTASPTFRRYLDELVTHLVDARGVKRKRVLEIGCGQGEFLARLCAAGGNRGVGFDPSWAGEAAPSGSEVTLLRQEYCPGGLDAEVDVICSRHVIEHVPRPGVFVEMLKDATASRPEVLVFIETPRLEWILEQKAFWDICYEHCSYFAMPVLAYLFERSGFDVVASWPAFGGQYQCLEARPVNGVRPDRPLAPTLVAGLVDETRAFAAACRRREADWRARLCRPAARGRYAVWGAGAKGVTFLNVLGLGPDTVPVVVDVNPAKQGTYIPGTGQPVVGPDALRAYDVQAVLVMNPNYLQEVRRMLEKEGHDVGALSL